MDVCNKKAVLLENEHQCRRFRELCKSYGILRTTGNTSLPVYMMLIKTPTNVSAVPNTILEGEEYSISEYGYNVISLNQFEHGLRKEFEHEKA